MKAGIAILWLVLAFSVGAQTLPDSTIKEIRFEQKLGAQVSLSLPFTDENGRQVTLGKYFGEKPVVVVMGYYRCPMLCTMVLNGLVEAASDMRWSIGPEFQVVDVSIDPNEGSALAAQKKRAYLKRYGRDGAEGGWHFLTGNSMAIRQLADEIGFRYAYDPASKQYAHPSGLVVLSPEGTVSHYLFGVAFAPKDLYGALRDASVNKTGGPIQQLILLCFHYNPLTGKYSATIVGILRLLGVLTVLSLVGLIVGLSRRGRATKTANAL